MQDEVTILLHSRVLALMRKGQEPTYHTLPLKREWNKEWTSGAGIYLYLVPLFLSHEMAHSACHQPKQIVKVTIEAEVERTGERWGKGGKDREREDTMLT